MKQDKRFNYKEAEESGKKFVRYKDGCKVYGMGISKFQEIAKKANAVYKVNQMVLVDTLFVFLLLHISLYLHHLDLRNMGKEK